MNPQEESLLPKNISEVPQGDNEDFFESQIPRESTQISHEDLIEIGESVKIEIGNDVIDFTPQAEARIALSTTSMGASPEMIAEARREFRLEKQLQEVQREVNYVGEVACSKIESILLEQELPATKIEPPVVENERERGDTEIAIDVPEPVAVETQDSSRLAWENIQQLKGVTSVSKENETRDQQSLRSYFSERDTAMREYQEGKTLFGRLKRFAKREELSPKEISDTPVWAQMRDREAMQEKGVAQEQIPDTIPETTLSTPAEDTSEEVVTEQKPQMLESVHELPELELAQQGPPHLEIVSESERVYSRNSLGDNEIDAPVIPKEEEVSENIAEKSQSGQEKKIDTLEKLPERSPLLKIFKEAGVDARVARVPNGGEFPQVIILKRNEISTEKMFRIYRGITRLDSSMFNQIPYAMRKEERSGKPTSLEWVRQEVNTLAQNPTYENLLVYTNKVRQHLDPEKVHLLDEELFDIEESILEGYGTGATLAHLQIRHNGGWGDGGITPYISATHNPYEAAGYARGGLMVIDIPLSEIGDYMSESGELDIKGALDPKYITAIMPREHNRPSGGNYEEEKRKRDEGLYQALQKVYEVTKEIPLYTDEEARVVRESKVKEGIKVDKQQWEKDIEMVRQKRIENLIRRFREVPIDLQSAQEKMAKEGIDIYTKVKRDIFDYYSERYANIGRHRANGLSIESHTYRVPGRDGEKWYDRDSINDSMLGEMRKLVTVREELEEERREMKKEEERNP